MTNKLEELKKHLSEQFGDDIVEIKQTLRELTVTVKPAAYFNFCEALKKGAHFKFEQLIDLCGLDVSRYGDAVEQTTTRFVVVLHLLSITLNQRLRVKTFCLDDELPSIASVAELWSTANWYEREAFDLFGIIFQGHPDLRRILTDYGFVGHPFRKDFPLSGHVEMRYDPELARVVYQPVTIEPREVTPRIIREKQYGGV